MSKRFEELQSELERRMWQTVAPLETTCWLTDEPVGFGERMSGTRKELASGDVWGEKLFDCAWFNFRGTVPAEAAGKELVARIDVNGELLVVDGEGNPVRGLTNRSSVYSPELGPPLKSVVRLAVGGTVDLWADAGFNDLFGAMKSDGSLAMAEIAVCRAEVRNLHYDVAFLSDWAEYLPEDDPQRELIFQSLENAERMLKAFSDEEAMKARGLLAPLLEPGEPSGFTVSAIGHAHLDLAWLWPIRETIRKGARTFSTALYLMEKYPDYVFGASQPQLFAWMKEHYPALYVRIKDAVANGRIELQGAAWVECDMNVTGGESIIRQFIHGARFWKEEFGAEVDNHWLPDVFGYNGQLPQVLKKAGINYFMTQKLSWNQINRFPYHSFHWEGIDGSAIPAHMLPEETYNSPAAPRSLLKIQNEYAEREVSGHALLLYGIGNGGGGPGAEHLEYLARAKNLPGLPNAKCRAAAEFFEEWVADADRFPRWKGELYLERHQGTFTTQARTKRNNRQCEIALRELEWVAVLAEQLAGVAYPTEALDRIWKEVLLYQFHDILPGSSIKRVYDESNARYAILLEELEKLIQQRCEKLAAGKAVVFNSLPFDRVEWIKLNEKWVRVEAPSNGWKALPSNLPTTGNPEAGVGRASRLRERAPSEWKHALHLVVEDNHIENEHLRVRFNSDGTISSLFDKAAGRETTTGKLNQFAIYEDHGDAWDTPLDYRDKEPVRPDLVSSNAFMDGPCAVMEQVYTVGTSRIRQQIVLKAESKLLEFETWADWHEEKAMLRAEFPVAVVAPESTSEIQFGTIRRPTHDTTSWDRAKEEIPAQQWVDLSDDEYGVSLLNDCKYGHRIKGGLIEINLIRCVPHPGGALIGSADLSGSGAPYELTDLGAHTFRYALYPHTGSPAAAGTFRLARAFNVPLRIVEGGEESIEEKSFFQLGSPDIDLVAVKKAEDGSGFVVRLCNMTSEAIATDLATALPFAEAVETNLMENGGEPLSSEPDGTVSLVFSPFEIKTVKLVAE